MEPEGGGISELLVSPRGEGVALDRAAVTHRRRRLGSRRRRHGRRVALEVEEDARGQRWHSRSKEMVLGVGRCSGSKKKARAALRGGVGRPGDVRLTNGGSPEVVLGVEKGGVRKFGSLLASKSNRQG
jgi:hypothetical protein